MSENLLTCDACGNQYDYMEHGPCPECGHDNKEQREDAGEEVDD